MLQDIPINTNLVIQAVTSDGYFQLIHQVSDQGYLTLTYCYALINRFTSLHPNWEFIYTGCL